MGLIYFYIHAVVSIDPEIDQTPDCAISHDTTTRKMEIHTAGISPTVTNPLYRCIQSCGCLIFAKSHAYLSTTMTLVWPFPAAEKLGHSNGRQHTCLAKYTDLIIIIIIIMAIFGRL